MNIEIPESAGFLFEPARFKVLWGRDKELELRTGAAGVGAVAQAAHWMRSRDDEVDRG
jgi:hypothetical protein